MKKLVTAILCALLVSAVPDFGVKTFAAEANAKPIYVIQIPNPFVPCETVEDAEKTAGFEITLPNDIPEGYDEQVIQAIKDDLIDVHYKSSDGDLNIRKSNIIDDCSGNYFNYTEMTKIIVSDRNVLLKCRDGKAYVAIWNNGTYSYSISVDDSSDGLDKDVMAKLIREMK